MKSSQQNTKKHKVALLFICTNPNYWQYAPDVVSGAEKHFLPNHNVDYFFWTDMPKDIESKRKEIKDTILPYYQISLNNPEPDVDQPFYKELMEQRQKDLVKVWETDIQIKTEVLIRKLKWLVDKDNVNFIETAPIEWPSPTLMRYHLFLQEEERLKDYDYIFYCDIDMAFVGEVGDEILDPDKGLTMAQHPMYALDRRYIAPYEPNPESSAYIPRLGRIQTDGQKKWFEPLYAAGGFQGGGAKEFIKAMWSMKRAIDSDFHKNYIAIWNDETHWNRYLFENPPAVVLSPAYVYPDSLINEVYVKIWGRNYEPKLVTLTKKFTLSKEGGQAVQDTIQKLQ